MSTELGVTRTLYRFPLYFWVLYLYAILKERLVRYYCLLNAYSLVNHISAYPIGQTRFFLSRISSGRIQTNYCFLFSFFCFQLLFFHAWLVMTQRFRSQRISAWSRQTQCIESNRFCVRAFCL